MTSRYTREIHTHGQRQTRIDTPGEGIHSPGPAGQALAPWRYNGGKGGAGVAQAIINCIPPHQVYIEAFVGGGAVFRAKSPAASSILIDLDPAVVGEWRRRCGTRPDVTILEGNALELVPSLVAMQPGAFVYMDPPYVHAARRDLKLYRHEMDDAGHHRLVRMCEQLPCLWALSGYRNAIYDAAAETAGWHRTDYRCMTRRGPVIESLWTNFKPSADLAEFSYAGSTFRERERIKRKVTRWASKFAALPELEQRAILAALTIGDRHE